MPHSLTLPTIAALSIAGVLLGVHLGRGAISEIDPLYLAPPSSSRFFADLVPAGYKPAPVGWSRPDDAVTNDLNISGRPECFDCRNFVEAELASETDASTTAAFESPSVEQAHALPPAIERYMSFPVTAEEAQRPRVERPEYAGAAAAEETSPPAVETDPINM